MTAPEVLPAGMCVCGREIPAGWLSDWACSEVCQSAWQAWQADPGYPHPREIRARADARQHHSAPEPGQGCIEGPPPEDGTQIDVDGTGFVRVGSFWQQTGPWSPLQDELGAALEYMRWCPQCRHRRRYSLHHSDTPGTPEGWQQCDDCAYQWPGRPLVGLVETRGDPWPGIRMRITDGYRSATHTVTHRELALLSTAAARPAGQILAAHWIRLERDLSDQGRNDQDQADNPGRHRPGRRKWDWRT